LQGVYLNPDEPAGNRIKAAAAAIGYERPKLAATGVVLIDFREGEAGPVKGYRQTHRAYTP
jgi:hypothetical protein